ncbi:MAG: type II toxin-antitoxin system HicA family toxin [Candidatus Aenigmarchaeota archaeon]|nr:type II toxin-antitoxin system HicA family toxin [Candidatus Aenigmarchaeota archaeon]
MLVCGRYLCNDFECQIIRTRGSHATLKRSDKFFTCLITNKELKRPTLKGILEGAGITEEEFMNSL